MEERWECTSVEEYVRHNTRGCPVYAMDDSTDTPPPTTPPPPPGRCLLVNDVCQFDTSSTLRCAFRQSQAGSCQYRCMEANGAIIPDTNCTSSGYPPPDSLCIPIDGQCREYNPCKFWKGFCSAPYRCGTLDDYYKFRFGPQPSCAQPPAGFVEPEPPGECVLHNNTCSWSST